MSHKKRFQYFMQCCQIMYAVHAEMCVLNIDANFEDCRQGFHVSQIQILVFCMVASTCVCHAEILSVFDVDITAQAWLPEIDVGKALGVLRKSIFDPCFGVPEATSTCSEGPEWLPGLP